MFVNSWVRTEKGWKISRLDFDLMDDNTAVITFDKKKRIHKTKHWEGGLALPDWNLIADVYKRQELILGSKPIYTRC